MKFKLDPDQLSRVDDAPSAYRSTVTRAYAGEVSPRSAIKAFCLQCVGYARNDVKTCPATMCPLHRYRPYQQTEEA